MVRFNGTSAMSTVGPCLYFLGICWALEGNGALDEMAINTALKRLMDRFVDRFTCFSWTSGVEMGGRRAPSGHALAQVRNPVWLASAAVRP
ncbi:MAG: hypothetical protein OXR72_14780 [Gemmatimonadota bacterium]|nr:hypothetical protein [Gemmatimonadota bacterium]